MSNVKKFRTMAKGNIFLGMGRGKVGDVVMYRNNGVQMARVRNRTPKNPRTNEQLYQRAVIATIMKAYSAGKEIFDHAFQSYTIGEGCMRRFNSVNARILRSQLFEDVNKAGQIDYPLARFVAPKSITCTPCIGMQVSEGTLTNTLFIANEKNGTATFSTPSSTITNVNDYLESLGVSAGDIFTFVYFVADLSKAVFKNPWYDGNEASQFNTKFGWLRFMVLDNISDSATLGTAKFSDVFNVTAGGDIIPTFSLDTAFNQGAQLAISFNLAKWAGSMACIRSRNDYDLRSTEYTVAVQSTDFGITSRYVLTAWQDAVLKVGESDLILEGGSAGGSTESGGSSSGSGSGGGPSGEVVPGSRSVVVTNSPQNMKPARGTARHKGTINETEG